jgi:hypothetical protein
MERRTVTPSLPWLVLLTLLVADLLAGWLRSRPS